MYPDPASLQSLGELLTLCQGPGALLLPKLGCDATRNNHHLHRRHSGGGAGEGQGRGRGGARGGAEGGAEGVIAMAGTQSYSSILYFTYY